MAGSSATYTHYALGYVRKLVVDWVADSATGAVPNLVLPAFEGRLFELTTNPGATAPTDNYDITIEDDQAIDRLQGVGANRHTTTTQSVPVVYSGSTIHPVISRSDVLTLKLAGNSVNSALGKIVLLYGPA